MRRLAAVALAGAALTLPHAVNAQTDPPPRSPLLDIPVGCPTQILTDHVVFVGTVTATDYRTVRYRIDQPRAGDLGRFASQVGNEYLVDVRYGVDTKYLHVGRQYLVGAAANPNNNGMLTSKITAELSPLGGNEVINANETDQECPELADPNMTVRVDGTPIDSGLLTPLLDDRPGILRAVLTAVGLVLGGVLALAAIRWILTGFGRGVESMSRPRARPGQPATAQARQPATASARGRATVPPARPRR